MANDAFKKLNVTQKSYIDGVQNLNMTMRSKIHWNNKRNFQKVKCDTDI